MGKEDSPQNKEERDDSIPFHISPGGIGVQSRKLFYVNFVRDDDIFSVMSKESLINQAKFSATTSYLCTEHSFLP